MWLVTENKKAGQRNGEKLVSLAATQHVPVLAFDAEHNEDRAAQRRPEEFNQLRTRVHLAAGASVMLISNQMWNTRTVQSGLMNGARGVVIAICGSAPPPKLPEFVVVDFPDYRGYAFWPDHPTWVPVPPIQRESKQAPQLQRTQLPLRLAWALTIHKAQGLTCPEGIVVDLSSSSAKRVPAASPGLAFVACTRVTDWDRMGFRNLPAFGDFLAVRGSKLFKARSSFEADMDARHDSTLAAWVAGWCAEVEIKSHIAYSRAAAQKRGEAFTADDEADVRSMLMLRGVRALPQEVIDWAKTNQKDKVTFAQVLSAFRGKSFRVVYGLRSGNSKGTRNIMNADAKASTVSDIALLQEMGFKSSAAAQALHKGGSISKALSYLWPEPEVLSRRQHKSSRPGEKHQYFFNSSEHAII